MTAQRLLKILAFIVVAALLAAYYQWRVYEYLADPWLLHLAASAFIAALVVALTGQDTRPRVMLRFLSGLSALVGVVALVADYSLPGPGFTSFSSHLSQFAPSLLAGVRTGITQTFGAGAWNSWGATFFAIPTFLLFFTFSIICGFASRRRHKVKIFVN